MWETGNRACFIAVAMLFSRFAVETGLAPEPWSNMQTAQVNEAVPFMLRGLSTDCCCCCYLLLACCCLCCATAANSCCWLQHRCCHPRPLEQPAVRRARSHAPGQPAATDTAQHAHNSPLELSVVSTPPSRCRCHSPSQTPRLRRSGHTAPQLQAGPRPAA